MTKTKTLAEYLKKTRSSQRALARALNISPSYLCDILAGRKQPSLEVAIRITEVTGVPVTALLRRAA